MLIESLSAIETIKTIGSSRHAQWEWEEATGDIATRSLKARTLSGSVSVITKPAGADEYGRHRGAGGVSDNRAGDVARRINRGGDSFFACGSPDGSDRGAHHQLSAGKKLPTSRSMRS